LRLGWVGLGWAGLQGLSASAWHDPARFEWTRRLEAAFPAMLQELRILMGEHAAAQGASQPPASWGSVGGRSTHDGDLVKAGAWNEFPLLGGTGPIVENLQKCPTCVTPPQNTLVCSVCSSVREGQNLRPQSARTGLTA